MMIGTVIILVLALDQMTKFLIRANFIVGETLPMIPDILHLTYVRNTGAAFSMFRNMPMVIVGFPILMVILCLAASVYCIERNFTGRAGEFEHDGAAALFGCRDESPKIKRVT